MNQSKENSINSMVSRNPKRGIPLARIPAFVTRVLIVRSGEIVTRTDKISAFGSKLWVTSEGKLHDYSRQTHVKPVYKYNQIFPS